MGEIAARAGVVASVIYDHFGSKRELHIELLQLHGEELIRRSITEIEGGDARRRSSASSIEAYFRFVEEDPFVWRFLFRDPPADPEIAAAWRRLHDRATAGIAGLIVLGVADRGRCRSACRPTRSAWMLAKAVSVGDQRARPVVVGAPRGPARAGRRAGDGAALGGLFRACGSAAGTLADVLGDDLAVHAGVKRAVVLELARSS